MIGDLLIGGAFFASLLGGVFWLDGRRKWSGLALWASFGFSSAAVALLLYALVVTDFSYVYVYRNTSTDLDMVYRVAALWTGQSGSLLFLLWCMTGAAALSSSDGASALQGGINATVAAVSLHLSPFAVQAAPPAQGLGFSPILKHLMMVFHPPAMFAGYAATGILFSVAVVSTVRGDPLRKELRRYASIGLVLIGASLVLGCEWSYEVWQDYWSWGPAFTSSLMTWLVLLGGLHLLLAERRWGLFRHSSRLVGGLSFVMALLSTFIVRSGSIQSIHSFAEDPRIRLILVLSASLLVGMALVFWRYWRGEKWPTGGAPLALSLGSLAAVTLGILYAYALMAALAANAFWGGATLSGHFLADASYPLALAGTGLLVLSTRRGVKKDVAVVALSATVATALFLGGYVDARGALVAALAVAVVGFAVAGGKLSGPAVAHAGLGLLVLGLLLASGPVSAEMEFSAPGDTQKLGPYTVELVDFSYEEGERFGGKFRITGRGGGWAVMGREGGSVNKGILIDRGLFEDVYITFGGAGSVYRGELLVMGVGGKVIRGVSLIWLGSLMTALGTVLSLLGPKSFPSVR